MHKKTKKILKTVEQTKKKRKTSILQNLLTENMTDELKNIGFTVNNVFSHSQWFNLISWKNMPEDSENNDDGFSKLLDFFEQNSFEKKDEVKEVKDNFLSIKEKFKIGKTIFGISMEEYEIEDIEKEINNLSDDLDKIDDFDDIDDNTDNNDENEIGM